MVKILTRFCTLKVLEISTLHLRLMLFEMKMTSKYKLAFGCCALLAFCCLNAQETDKNEAKEIKVVKKTLMELYAPELILDAEERTLLKKQRIALIEKRRKIIDTLSISKRRKRSLLRELYSTPYSEKWDKWIADIAFENDPYQ